MEDILEARRLNGDLWWVTRDYNCPLYKHGKNRKPTQIKQDVIKSRAVQHTIAQLIIESGKSKDELMQEAFIILEQMGHNFNLTFIRIFGLILSKSWKKLYRGICVDKESIETVRKLIPDYPILLMPTHRSYMDFLVMSFCFYHYDLPLPIIAGGQDFMSMNIVGTMLRNAGAFFIRRSFGKDKLYWAIFSEYVRTIMINGDAPMEFFVEGTRSRTAKSLAPKYGLLSAALDPFFKADVPDIYIVPVSITYDRTLEEELYAYELLGIPKPKESTRGLLKARKIFNNEYGKFYMKFGMPMSLRGYCGHRIDRSIHNFCRYLSPLTQEEHKVVADLAHETVRIQQKNLILPPFVFIATILVNYMQNAHLEISLYQLIEELRWFLTFLNNRAPFTKASEVSELITAKDSAAAQIIKLSCRIHPNIVQLIDDTVHIIEIKPNLPSNIYEIHGLSEEMMRKSVTQILLSHYSNQVLHLMVPEGLIALIVKCNPDTTINMDGLYSEYEFLGTVLQLDFIISKGEINKEEFNNAVAYLRSTAALHGTDDALSQPINCRINHFLLQLFEPFLVAYNIVCQVLLDAGKLQTPATVKVIAKAAQAEGERLLLKENVLQSIILSLDTLTNAVGSLALMGALKKEFSNGHLYYSQCFNELLPLARRLAPYSRWCGINYLNDVSDIWLDTRAKL